MAEMLNPTDYAGSIIVPSPEYFLISLYYQTVALLKGMRLFWRISCLLENAV